MMTTTHVQTPMTVKNASQQVVVVSKQTQLNGLLETVLDAGQYDVVFVESTEHAYSHIKRLTPHAGNSSHCYGEANRRARSSPTGH